MNLHKMRRARPFSSGYKVGMKVLINVNSGTNSSGKPFYKMEGTVTNVDGEYIKVKPKWHRHVIEFYPCELKKLQK